MEQAPGSRRTRRLYPRPWWVRADRTPTGAREAGCSSGAQPGEAWPLVGAHRAEEPSVVPPRVALLAAGAGCVLGRRNSGLRPLAQELAPYPWGYRPVRQGRAPAKPLGCHAPRRGSVAPAGKEQAYTCPLLPKLKRKPETRGEWAFRRLGPKSCQACWKPVRATRFPRNHKQQTENAGPEQMQGTGPERSTRTHTRPPTPG